MTEHSLLNHVVVKFFKNYEYTSLFGEPAKKELLDVFMNEQLAKDKPVPIYRNKFDDTLLSDDVVSRIYTILSTSSNLSEIKTSKDLMSVFHKNFSEKYSAFLQQVESSASQKDKLFPIIKKFLAEELGIDSAIALITYWPRELEAIIGKVISKFVLKKSVKIDREDLIDLADKLGYNFYKEIANKISEWLENATPIMSILRNYKFGKNTIKHYSKHWRDISDHVGIDVKQRMIDKFKQALEKGSPPITSKAQLLEFKNIVKAFPRYQDDLYFAIWLLLGKPLYPPYNTEDILRQLAEIFWPEEIDQKDTDTSHEEPVQKPIVPPETPKDLKGIIWAFEQELLELQKEITAMQGRQDRLSNLVWDLKKILSSSGSTNILTESQQAQATQPDNTISSPWISPNNTLPQGTGAVDTGSSKDNAFNYAETTDVHIDQLYSKLFDRCVFCLWAEESIRFIQSFLVRVWARTKETWDITPSDENVSTWLNKQLQEFIRKNKTQELWEARSKLSQSKEEIKPMNFSYQEFKNSLHAWIDPIYKARCTENEKHIFDERYTKWKSRGEIVSPTNPGSSKSRPSVTMNSAFEKRAKHLPYPRLDQEPHPISESKVQATIRDNKLILPWDVPTEHKDIAWQKQLSTSEMQAAILPERSNEEITHEIYYSIYDRCFSAIEDEKLSTHFAQMLLMHLWAMTMHATFEGPEDGDMSKWLAEQSSSFVEKNGIEAFNSIREKLTQEPIIDMSCVDYKQLSKSLQLLMMPIFLEKGRKADEAYIFRMHFIEWISINSIHGMNNQKLPDGLTTRILNNLFEKFRQKLPPFDPDKRPTTIIDLWPWIETEKKEDIPTPNGGKDGDKGTKWAARKPRWPYKKRGKEEGIDQESKGLKKLGGPDISKTLPISAIKQLGKVVTRSPDENIRHDFDTFHQFLGVKLSDILQEKRQQDPAWALSSYLDILVTFHPEKLMTFKNGYLFPKLNHSKRPARYAWDLWFISYLYKSITKEGKIEYPKWKLKSDDKNSGLKTDHTGKKISEDERALDVPRFAKNRLKIVADLIYPGEQPFPMDDFLGDPEIIKDYCLANEEEIKNNLKIVIHSNAVRKGGKIKILREKTQSFLHECHDYESVAWLARIFSCIQNELVGMQDWRNPQENPLGYSQGPDTDSSDIE